MRVVVVSDTHGRKNSLFDIINKHKDEAELFLHLGDGMGDVIAAKSRFKDINIIGVRGNCDFTQDKDFPIERLITVGHIKIFMTHGHEYYVKARLDNICYRACELGANIALFGHTHNKITGYQDGLYIMNPGSPSVSHGTGHSYGTIDITDTGIFCNLIPTD